MARKKINDAELRRVVEGKFGFDELYPGQEEAIRSIVGGQDTLAVMPTGAGKSATYQIAGRWSKPSASTYR